MFGVDQLFLVIEECDGLTYDEIMRFQRRYRAREATPLDETIRDKVCYVTAQYRDQVERAHGLPVTSRTVVLWPRVSVSKV